MTRGLGRGRLARVRAAGGRIVWRARWTDAEGRRRERNLSGVRRVAERLLDRLLVERDELLGGLRPREPPLDELVRRYIGHLAARCSQGYVHATEQVLRSTLRDLCIARLDQLSPADWESYRASRLRTVSVSTVNKQLVAVRGLAAWAERVGLGGENRLAGMRSIALRPHHRTYQRRALDDDEIARLLGAARELDLELGQRREPRAPGGRRVPQEPVWAVLLGTGGRWTETAALRWADLDGDLVTFRACTTKAQRVRVVPLVPELQRRLEELRQRLGEPGDEVHVLLTPRGLPWAEAERRNALRMLRTTLRRAGVPVRTAEGQADLHALRHSAATRWARAGVPLLHSQRLLGHSDPAITSRCYVHLTADDLRASLRAALDGHGWPPGE